MEYTWAALVAVVALVAVELLWWKTGIFATATYWIAYGIVVFFQILVDGWLTKLSAPIVLYNPDKVTDWRVPFDVPVEDYLFGFVLVTLTIMLWVRAGHGGGRGRPAGRGHEGGATTTRAGTPPSPPR